MNKEEMIKKYEDYRERLNAYELMILMNHFFRMGHYII